MTGQLLMVSGAVGVDAGLLYPHQFAVDTGSGYNLIAEAHLPSGWEKCIV